jgi:hypothetical protein
MGKARRFAADVAALAGVPIGQHVRWSAVARRETDVMADGGATIESNPANSGNSGLERLIEIGLALSAERNHERLSERILLEAIGITKADGGTLYLCKGEGTDRTLKFEILRNGTLKIAMGGTTGVEIKFPPLRLYTADSLSISRMPTPPKGSIFRVPRNSTRAPAIARNRF